MDEVAPKFVKISSNNGRSGRGRRGWQQFENNSQIQFNVQITTTMFDCSELYFMNCYNNNDQNGDNDNHLVGFLKHGDYIHDV